MRNELDFVLHREDASLDGDVDLLKSLIERRRTTRSSATLSRRLLRHFGRIGRVLRASPEELEKVRGIDRTIVREFGMARALIEAMARADLEKAHMLDEPEAVFGYCRLLLAGERREKLHALYLDKSFRLIAQECLQVGTVDHVAVYPREVMGRAIQHAATSIILVHNHSSGNSRPSGADIAMTRELERAGRYLQISLADHIIVGGSGNFSFRNNGLLPFRG
jgi:DNA repair protein RadC